MNAWPGTNYVPPGCTPIAWIGAPGSRYTTSAYRNGACGITSSQQFCTVYLSKNKVPLGAQIAKTTRPEPDTLRAGGYYTIQFEDVYRLVPTILGVFNRSGHPPARVPFARQDQLRRGLATTMASSKIRP